MVLSLTLRTSLFNCLLMCILPPLQTEKGGRDIYGLGKLSTFWLNFLSCWSKYVIATWSWRTHCWMVVPPLVWRYVILDIPRYNRFFWWWLFQIPVMFLWVFVNLIISPLLLLFLTGLLSVFSSALTTKVNCGDSCLYCSRGVIKARIWWQGETNFCIKNFLMDWPDIACIFSLVSQLLLLFLCEHSLAAAWKSLHDTF